MVAVDGLTPELHEGVRAELHGLQKAPSLNGRVGTLQSFDAVGDRWNVELEGEGGVKSVRTANLRPLPAAPAASVVEVIPADVPPPPADAGPGPLAEGPFARDGGLLLYLNLDRRPDRRAKMEALAAAPGLRDLGVPLRRISAVDGASLGTWAGLVEARQVSAQAAEVAEKCEVSGYKTLDHRQHVFSPHLTRGAVGCALSFRLAWEALLEAEGAPYALILEDDVEEVCPCLAREIETLLKSLPENWHMCFLGYHAADPRLLRGPPLSGGCVGFMEASKAPNGNVTGNYAMLVSYQGAEMLRKACFPLELQLDVAFSVFYNPLSFKAVFEQWHGSLRRAGITVPTPWAPKAPPRKVRAFAVNEHEFLVLSPLSQESGDTDIQTMG